MIGLVVAGTALAAAPPPHVPTEPVRVAEVYDGDTLTLASGEKVRVSTINAPERRPAQAFAEDARQLAIERVLDRYVTLVPAAEPPIDVYGRLLARVRTADGDLSTALVEAGLAHVFVIPPAPADLGALLAAEATARSAQRGIWSLPAMQQTFHLTSFHANARGDDARNVNGEYLRLCNVSGRAAELWGWSIEDRSGDRFGLPALVVPPGHTVAVRVGKGTDQLTPDAPLVVHLGSPVPVWDNRYEVLVLKDPTGRVVTRRVHGSKERLTRE